MRPVDLQPIAEGAAQHLVYRDAERFRLDVDQRVLDRGDRLGVDAAGGLDRCRVKLLRDPLDRPRVLPDQPLAKSFDYRAEAERAVTLHELRPADDALVGADLYKRAYPPPGVAVEGLDLGDFH